MSDASACGRGWPVTSVNEAVLALALRSGEVVLAVASDGRVLVRGFACSDEKAIGRSVLDWANERASRS